MTKSKRITARYENAYLAAINNKKSTQLRLFRLDKAISQKDMAVMLKTTQQGVSKWEDASIRMPHAKIILFAEVARRYHCNLNIGDIVKDYL